MLRRLSIENYALIRSASLDFEHGFTVITGETGAGKSILLGALALLLGNRADSQVLFDKNKKCVVEAVFKINTKDVRDILQANDFDEYDDNSLILRREIGSNGKTRSFINDTPCSLTILKELSAFLIDIHSQHKTLELVRPSFLIEMIDSYIPKEERVEGAYTPLYTRFKELKSKIEDLREKRENWDKEQAYWRFLYEELNSAKLKEQEQQEIERELEFQLHIEQIQEAVSMALSQWEDGENSMSSNISAVYQKIKKIAQYHPKINESLPRWESVIIELKDLHSEMALVAQDLDYSKEKKEQYEERLNLLYRLESKHRVQTVEELIEKRKELEKNLLDADGREEEEDKLNKELLEIEEKLEKISLKWSESRKKAGYILLQRTKESLESLGMKDAELSIRWEKEKCFSIKGVDKANMLFNANKGGELAELSKVVSGGELSRLMLALKSVVHERKLIGSLVLDEIDTGVSGEIAGKVASMMKKMSDYMQIISITHLPQIAAKADSHLRVSKMVENGQTVSKIEKLDNELHIQTIAAMISNDNISPQALEVAKVLIKGSN